MDYIVALENLKPLRRVVSDLKFTEPPERSKMVSWFYSWMKEDYDSQKKEIKSFHSLKNENNVRIVSFRWHLSSNNTTNRSLQDPTKSIYYMGLTLPSMHIVHT